MPRFLPPFRLIFVSLAVAAIVGLGVYELSIDDSGPLSLLSIPMGLAFLLAVALGRSWTLQMGSTVAGLLLVHGVYLGLMSMSAVEYGRRGMLTQDEAPYIGATAAERVVVGLLLLWCVRQRVVIHWLAERESRRA